MEIDDQFAESGRVAIEAQQWLQEYPDRFQADRFGVLGSALWFVNELYAAGAARVDVLLEPGKSGTNYMRVTLPKEFDKRDRIIGILSSELEYCGEDFDAFPNGIDRQQVSAEVARDLGRPEFEGTWMSEGNGIHDIGQESLTLWWG